MIIAALRHVARQAKCRIVSCDATPPEEDAAVKRMDDVAKRLDSLLLQQGEQHGLSRDFLEDALTNKLGSREHLDVD